MISSNTNKAKRRGSWINFLLFPLAMLLLTAVQARADDFVAGHGGVIDGFVNPVPPSQIQIDGNCTIRNFPASNPLTTNFSFFGNTGPWLLIFDNVVHIGNMSCDIGHGNKIWFTNSSSSTIKQKCQS